MTYSKNMTDMFHPFLSQKLSDICLATVTGGVFLKIYSVVLTFSYLGFCGLTWVV